MSAVDIDSVESKRSQQAYELQQEQQQQQFNPIRIATSIIEEVRRRCAVEYPLGNSPYSNVRCDNTISRLKKCINFDSVLQRVNFETFPQQRKGIGSRHKVREIIRKKGIQQQQQQKQQRYRSIGAVAATTAVATSIDNNNKSSIDSSSNPID